MKAGWIQQKLGEVTTKIGSGATPLGGEEAYKTSGISLIRSLNVYDDGFRDRKLARIDEEQAARLSNVVVEAGDVLLNITGASIARCCVAPIDFLPARVNQHVSIIRPIKQKIDSAFLQYLLISKTYKDRLLHTGEEGGSTRQAITKAQLQDFSVEFPESLPEQQRIVTLLDEAFDGIATARAQAEKNLQNARAIFESYLQTVVSGAFDVGESVSLSDLATDISDGDHMPPPKALQGVPFITIGNIAKDTRTIDFSDTFMVSRTYFDGLKANKKPQIGDVLYTVTGTFGVPVLVSHSREFCFQRHIGLIRPKSNVSSEWLYYLLMSPQMFQQANDGATGTAQKTVSLKVLRSYQVPRIPLSAQLATVAKLDSLFTETQRLESLYQRKFIALDELKKSLLAQAFSGAL